MSPSLSLPLQPAAEADSGVLGYHTEGLHATPTAASSLTGVRQRLGHRTLIYALALMANNLLVGWMMGLGLRWQHWGHSVGSMVSACGCLQGCMASEHRAVWTGSIGPHVSDFCW